MNIINARQWDKLRDDFSSATFPSICIDQFLDTDFAERLAAAYPSFSNAQSMGLEFTKVNEMGKVQITDPGVFPDEVKKLVEELSSPTFIENLETLSGISNLVWDPDFGGGGMHLTRSRGHLDVHVDFNYAHHLQMHRRINLLIYLNKEWQDSWGGELELWDSGVKRCFKSLTPILNRCVIFATSEMSYHGVRAVTGPEDLSRNSFAVYYYTREAPSGWNGKEHSTIFKARPEEKFKKFISMPIESVLDSKPVTKVINLKKRLLSEDK